MRYHTGLIVLALIPLSASVSDAEKPPAFARRTETTEEDLRKQLLSVTDIGLSQKMAAELYAQVDAQVKRV